MSILLPGQWPPMPPGLQQIDPNNFEGRLYRFENVKPSGIPSLFANPFVFSKRLERDLAGISDEFRQFSTLIRGVFLGVLRVESIPTINLGLFGQVAQGFESGMANFAILKYNNQPVGGIYPECLVFPSRRLTENILNTIEPENVQKENDFGSDNIRGHFKQWVSELINRTDANGNLILNPAGLPLWANKLLLMINAGGIWDASHINLNLLPPLTNRSLRLSDVDVSGGNGGTIQIPLVRYMDYLITCAHNGKVLSNEDKVLRLGGDKQILCTTEAGQLLCNNCPTGGVGPTIEEKGFFERRQGQGDYIIWRDFAGASRPRGCIDIKYNDNHAIFTFGFLKIRIDGEVVSKERIFCDRVIKFDNGDMPDLPVKSEYLDCINSNLIQGQTYQIGLKGINQLITHAPGTIDGHQASIILWPSFKAPMWNVNYAYLYPSTVLSAKRPQIKLINFMDNNLNVLENIGQHSGKKVDLPITHVEVFLTEDGQQEKPVGIFKDRRPDACQVAGGAIDLALDFGTSNTSLAIKSILGGGNPVYKELRIEDKSQDILGYYLDRHIIHEGAPWVPSYLPAGLQQPLSVPSELIFKSGNDKIPANLNAPIFRYSIPHPAYTRESAHREVVFNFKWIPPSPFNNHVTETRKAYLKMLMHMVLAMLREAPYATNTVNFTATYPLAFGNTKYNDYRGLLIQLISELHHETGMQIPLRPVAARGQDALNPALIPESHAGVARFVTTGYKFVVDIGGHTTDIALSRGDKILVVDSISYAGDVYISCLADNFPIHLCPKNLTLDPNSPNTLTQQAKKIILNREIRRNGLSRGVLNKENDTNRDRAIGKLELFFGLLFEHLYGLLQSHNIQRDITLYPVGNAWELTDAIPNIGGVENYIESWFRAKNIDLNVVSPLNYAGAAGASTRKGAVATGALMLADRRTFVPPDFNRCPVKSVVGCDVEISWGNNSRLINKNEPIPLNLNIPDTLPMPIISTERFIKSLELGLRENIVLTKIIHNFNGDVQNKLVQMNGTWQLTSSLFAVFLEKIVPMHYL